MFNNKNISQIFSIILMLVLFTVNTIYASSIPENIELSEIGLGETEISQEESEFSLDELVIENIPEQVLNEIDLDKEDVVEISTRDADDLSSITVVNADDTETLYMFSEPVKYIDEQNNEIKFIDNTINAAEEQEGAGDKSAYKSSGNSFDVDFSEKLSDGILLDEGDYSLKMTPLFENDSQADKKNVDFGNNNAEEQNGIEYADAFGKDVHLQYEVVNSGLKESILVKEYDGNNIYEFEIQAKGLVPDAYEGTQIEFMDEKTGQSVFTVQPTFLEDSYEGEKNENEVHVSYDNYYTLKETDEGNYLLTMVIDKEFMENPNTVYPVLIDPTIMVGQEIGFQSSYAFQLGETTSYVNGVLWVGTYSTRGEGISYIKTTGMTSRKYINPDNVISATFNITDYSITNPPPTCKVNLYDSNTTAGVANVTYSSLASAMGSLQSSATFTTRYADYAFDVTYLTKQWLKSAISQGGWTQNYGFILRGDLGTSAPGRRMDSTSMVLVIRYSTDENIGGNIYNIKNVQQNKYLFYNSSGTLSMGSYPNVNATKWKVTRDSQSGAYTIRPVSNLNLAINVTSSNFAAGTSVVANGGTNPFWRIVKNNDGSFRMIPGSNQSQVSTAITVPTNFTYLQEYTNTSSQKWIFEPVMADIGLSDYYITNVNNNKNLSLNSQNYTCVATPSQNLDNQRWSFVKQSDGTYMIFNTTGDWATEYLNTKHGKNFIGTETTGNNVKQCSNGGKYWRLIVNSDSTFSFVNTTSGNYLTLDSNLTDVRALPYANTSNQKWKLEIAKKDICVGGMRSQNGDGSEWVDYDCIEINNIPTYIASKAVENACNQIGYRTLTKFNQGNAEAVRDMIRRSSIFVIDTHGLEGGFGIRCNPSATSDKVEDRTYLASKTGYTYLSVPGLPDNCFATTRLVFLSACESAAVTTGDNPNIVTALNQKGVQTVMGYKISIFNGPDDTFLRAFMTSIGNGRTLGQAKSDAEKAVDEKHGTGRGGSMGSNLIIEGNDDMTATFRY